MLAATLRERAYSFAIHAVLIATATLTALWAAALVVGTIAALAAISPL